MRWCAWSRSLRRLACGLDSRLDAVAVGCDGGVGAARHPKSRGGVRADAISPGRREPKMAVSEATVGAGSEAGTGSLRHGSLRTIDAVAMAIAVLFAGYGHGLQHQRSAAFSGTRHHWPS